MSSISYDLTRIRAFVFDVDGVLSTSTIPLSPDGEPLRMISTKDGYAIQLAVKRGYHIAIITGGNTVAIKNRFQALGIKDIFQSVAHKKPVLMQWMSELGLSAGEVAYMGDDIPDLMAMRAVGLPCAPYDAAAEARDTAIFISRFSGGHGAVRDLIEQVLKTNGDWMADDDAFGW